MGYGMNKLKIILFLVLINSFSAFAGGEEIERCDLVQIFQQYSEAIDSSPGSVPMFFSRKIRDEWLRYILEETDDLRMAEALLLVRNRAFFGKRVSPLTAVQETHANGQHQLSGRYHSEDSSSGGLLIISFVREAGNCVISEVEYNTWKGIAK